MNYKITSFTPEFGCITVAYYDGKKKVGEFNIDLPIENGQFPDVDALDKLIQVYAPVYQVEREKALAKGINGDHIAALVTKK